MGKVVKLVDNFDSLYDYVTNEGRTFWFRSNMDAPKYKVGQAGYSCFACLVVLRLLTTRHREARAGGTHSRACRSR